MESIFPQFRKTIVTLLLIAGTAQYGMADTPSWYVGVQGGTSFGQSTFRSITEHEMHWGAQGGVFGGRQLNRLLSVEAALQYGMQKQSILDCCMYYWLSEDGAYYFSPVINETGWFYYDLQTQTQWGKLAVQMNADLLSLFSSPECRWSLNVGPQIGLVTTKTKLITPDRKIAYDRQNHLGLGGQVSVGYRLTEKIGTSLYGGITCLTGEHFDNQHFHKSNLIWDTGLKVSFSIADRKRDRAEKRENPAAPAEDTAARLAAERAEQERVAAESAAREAREQAEREAREAAARAEREQAEREAERTAAFNTPIPNVYFANNSSKVGEAYLSQLEVALAILNRYPDFNLEIHAYCSDIGSVAYNEMLSRRRMEAIQNWFIEHGIPSDRMGKAYYHGIDKNAPSAEEARRAELWFVK